MSPARPLRRFLRVLVVLLGPLAAVSSPAAAEPPAGVEMVEALAALGPRVPGTPGHAAAVELLLAAMRQAGLEEVRTEEAGGSPPLLNLSGRLPADGEDEIVLAAHFDTVPGSPGALDDASGCAAVIAAAADLARTPRSHPVRVVLFDGEESGLAGSRAWVERRDEAARRRLLALLDVDMVGWRDAPGPAVYGFAVPGGGGRVTTPGWLVHAVLRGGEGAGWRPTLGDPLRPFLSQLVLRLAASPMRCDADSLLAAGIPAACLSDLSPSAPDPDYHRAGDLPARLDGDRLARWSVLLAAVVRRLDALPGRPRPEDAYLVVGGRVLLRRDLYWLGFLLWTALVWRGYAARRGSLGRGLPAPASGRLPGFVFRLLLLVALLAEPVLAVPLLAPAAALALVSPRRPALRRALAFAGLVPLAVLSAAYADARLRGAAGAWVAGPGPLLLVAATLASYGWLMVASAAMARSHSASEL